MPTRRNREVGARPSLATDRQQRPQVRRIDPSSARFRAWMVQAQRESPRRALGRSQLPARRAALRAPVAYVHAYANVRPKVDQTTCGQAAIATLLDFHGRDPFHLPRRNRDPRDDQLYWDDGEVIDAVKAGGFGPDTLGGVFGTSPAQIKDALDHFGLNAVVSHASRAQRAVAWADLQAYVAPGRPAAVLVDCTSIGGPKLAMHWAIIYGVDGDAVRLGNWWPDRIPIETFWKAWECPQVPALVRHYHHCAIVAA